MKFLIFTNSWNQFLKKSWMNSMFRISTIIFLFSCRNSNYNWQNLKKFLWPPKKIFKKKHTKIIGLWEKRNELKIIFIGPAKFGKTLIVYIIIATRDKNRNIKGIISLLQLKIEPMLYYWVTHWKYFFVSKQCVH